MLFLGSAAGHTLCSLPALTWYCGVASAKPAFFMDGNRAPLFEVDISTGMLQNTDQGTPLAQVIFLHIVVHMETLCNHWASTPVLTIAPTSFITSLIHWLADRRYRSTYSCSSEENCETGLSSVPGNSSRNFWVVTYSWEVTWIEAADVDGVHS